MSRAFPIWHNVSACHYKSDKSYGGRDTSEDNIVVGSSASNSHDFVHTKTLRRFFEHETYGHVCVFKYYVDSIKIKEMIFEDNDGKAGAYIATWNLFETLKKSTRSKTIKGLVT